MTKLKSKKLRVTFFQRKPRVSSYSLEFVFENLREQLADEIVSKLHVAPFFSNGFFRRLGILLAAKLNEGKLNHVTGDINFASILLRKRRTVLTILDCAAVVGRVGITSWLLRKIWFVWPSKRCAIITTISEAARQDILHTTGIQQGKVKVIPLAVSSVFQSRPYPDVSAKPRILQVGASPNKNLPRVIQAIENTDCVLVIIGALTEDQERLLTRSRVDFENHVGLSTEELLEQYEKCHVVVFASLFEGFGMPIVEAQVVGRPVVTSTVTSMPEVAGDGAVLVDPYSVASIRQGILHVLGNPTFREDLISKGTDNAKRFDLSKVAKQYLDVYQSLSG